MDWNATTVRAAGEAIVNAWETIIRGAAASPARRQRQHRSGRPHLGFTRGPARECDVIAAPLVHIPVLVDMGGNPGRLNVERDQAESDGTDAAALTALQNRELALIRDILQQAGISPSDSQAALEDLPLAQLVVLLATDPTIANRNVFYRSVLRSLMGNRFPEGTKIPPGRSESRTTAENPVNVPATKMPDGTTSLVVFCDIPAMAAAHFLAVSDWDHPKNY